jgi:hypothetical protein
MIRQTWCVVSVLGAAAFMGCGQAPPPAPKPVAAAVAPATVVEAQAAQPVTDSAPTTPPIDALRAALAAATDEESRVRAVDAIAALGPNARGAFDDLVKASADASSRVRWHAARGLGLIGEDAVAGVPLLVKLLDDADPIVVTQAAAAIGLMRADDEAANMPEVDKAAYEAAATALVAKMTHPDPRVRRAVLRAIAKLQPDIDRFAPLVSERLSDADPSVVLPALHSLADMGGEAVPFLIKALENPKSRYWASVALAEIGAERMPGVGATYEDENCRYSRALRELSATLDPRVSFQHIHEEFSYAVEACPSFRKPPTLRNSCKETDRKSVV